MAECPGLHPAVEFKRDQELVKRTLLGAGGLRSKGSKVWLRPRSCSTRQHLPGVLAGFISCGRTYRTAIMHTWDTGCPVLKAGSVSSDSNCGRLEQRVLYTEYYHASLYQWRLVLVLRPPFSSFRAIHHQRGCLRYPTATGARGQLDTFYVLSVAFVSIWADSQAVIRPNKASR